MPFIGEVTGNPYHSMQRRATRTIRPLTEMDGSPIADIKTSSFGGEVYLIEGEHLKKGDLVLVDSIKASDPSIRTQYPRTATRRVELVGADNVVDFLMVEQAELETAVSDNRPLIWPKNAAFWLPPSAQALLITEKMVYGPLPFTMQNGRIQVAWSHETEFFMLERDALAALCRPYEIKQSKKHSRTIALKSQYTEALRYLQHEGDAVRAWPWEQIKLALHLRPTAQFMGWLNEQADIEAHFEAALYKQLIEPKEIELREAETAFAQEKIEHARDIALARQVLKLEESAAVENQPTSLHEATNFSDQRQLLRHVQDYVRAKGYYFEDELLANFWTCLKANYLTILAGISGTGKSKLPQYMGEALDAKVRLIPVKPNWHDSRDLLGFYNPLTQSFQHTRFLQALLAAKQEEDQRLWIIILDEMNLASVEHYFADFLSLLEQDGDGIEIELDGWDIETWEKTRNHWREQRDVTRLHQTLQLKPPILMPRNVRFVGTVNIDQTTQMLSDKLLDRADVIQFERVDLAKLPLEARWQRIEKGGTRQRLLPVQFRQWATIGKASSEALAQLRPYSTQLQQLNQILEKANLHFGFRVLTEVERYLLQIIAGGDYLGVDRAYDLQIKQRVLPRIRRMVADPDLLKQTLEETLHLLQDYPGSRQKIEEGFLRQLKQGFVNYWELGT
jgi:hypothetical protein